MPKYDLAVAYRIYPQVSRPARGLPFSEDKLRSAEICLRSFKESVEGLRVKVWAILDGCPESYADLFRKYFGPNELVLVPLPSVGNLPTFGKQLDILLSQTDSDLVYLAEDDYVYQPKLFSTMVEFLKSHKDVDFVTPYDHLDCYTLEIHNHPKWLRVHSGRHWRTAASTCLTFLTRKSTLAANESTFRTYCRRNYDCSLWLSMTKFSIFNPIQTLRFAWKQPWLAKIVAKAWLYDWAQILFGKRVTLWVPVPAIATHLDTRALSPNVDWAALMNTIAASIDFEKSVDSNPYDRRVSSTSRA
jgi:hypothetical protein